VIEINFCGSSSGQFMCRHARTPSWRRPHTALPLMCWVSAIIP